VALRSLWSQAFVTALAGAWCRDADDARRECHQLLLQQSELSPDGMRSEGQGCVAFGRGLYKTLPEDDWDRQPIYLERSALLIVADIRIDNRQDFENLLGLTAASSVSDAELFALAYEKSGDKVFEDIVGDFAVAVWSSRQAELTLARDPGGQRPMHYRVDNDQIRFCSMPRPLARKESTGICAVNERHVATFIADIQNSGTETYYSDVHRVEPGTVCRFSDYGRSMKHRSFWAPPESLLKFKSDREYQEAFLELLDTATRARLRRRCAAVGGHLSAGLDSTAVATSAATILGNSDQRFIALTSAPRQGGDWPAPKGRISDESEYAAETAARYPNIDHAIVRPSNNLLDILQRDATLFQSPIGHPCNHSWWSALNEAARARGANVVLTGEIGNLTISAGRVSVLSDILFAGHVLTWAREAARIGRSADLSWKGLMAVSLRPIIPHALWSLALKRRGTSASGREGLQFVQDAWLPQLEDGGLPTSTRGNLVYKSDRDTRLAIIRDHDPAVFKKATLGRWGVDERDVTVDRRLVDFCFGLPASQLLRDGVRRRLARTALRGRAPARVLHAPRGYQCADWFASVDKRQFDALISRLEASSSVTGLLRLDRMREAIASWPPHQLGAESVIARYRLALLRAASAGCFLAGAQT
jgi:asparagine synthase (glutamine-hydrolysing)